MFEIKKKKRKVIVGNNLWYNFEFDLINKIHPNKLIKSKLVLAGSMKILINSVLYGTLSELFMVCKVIKKYSFINSNILFEMIKFIQKGVMITKVPIVKYNILDL